MKHHLSTLVLSALAVVAVGGLTVLRTNLVADAAWRNTATLVTKNYPVSNGFTDISITEYYADVELRASRDGTVSVTTRDAEDVTHTVTVKNGTLSISRPEPTVGERWFHDDDDDPKVVVYLPAGDYGALTVNTTIYATATGLIPDGLTVGSVDYRGTAGDPIPSLGNAYNLYRAARQTVSSSDLMGITVLVPQEAGLTQAVEAINSVWQRELSLFFSLEEVDEETFAERIAGGDYAIALAPVECTDGSVYSLLRSFGPEGLARYDDTGYETLLAQSAAATSSEVRCALLAQAERQLLESCAAVPLFAQQKRLLIADGVEGLVFDPYGPVLDLTWTTKE